MKRTNLVLDAKLLEETRKVASAKTYSDAVNQAMSEYVRRAKVESIVEFFGKGLWQGDLAEMRNDNPRLPATKVRRKTKRTAKTVTLPHRAKR